MLRSLHLDFNILEGENLKVFEVLALSSNALLLEFDSGFISLPLNVQSDVDHLSLGTLASCINNLVKVNEFIISKAAFDHELISNCV